MTATVRQRRQAAKASLLDVLASIAAQWTDLDTTAEVLGVTVDDVERARVELVDQLQAWARRIEPLTLD